MCRDGHIVQLLLHLDLNPANINGPLNPLNLNPRHNPNPPLVRLHLEMPILPQIIVYIAQTTQYLYYLALRIYCCFVDGCFSTLGAF